MIFENCFIAVIVILQFEVPGRASDVIPACGLTIAPNNDIFGPVQTQNFRCIAGIAEQTVPVLTKSHISRVLIKLDVKNQGSVINGRRLRVEEVQGIGTNERNELESIF